MKRIQFTASINAPVATVYNKMIGKETFKQWTSVFNPSSDYEGGDMEGNWEKGSKVGRGLKTIRLKVMAIPLP